MRTHLASLVEDFRRHADETAVVAHRGNRRYRTTYGELAHLAGRFAAELERRGIAPGERVVLWGGNSSEWMSAFFGCLLRGVLAVPLDAAGSADFAARVIADVSPKLILGDPALLDSLPNAAEIPRLALLELASNVPAEPNFAVSEAVTGQTPFQIVFTSGTTSDPKGIVHTHANVLASVRPIENEMRKFRRAERLVHPLRFLHTLPLSHVFGQFMGLWLPGLLAAEVHFAEQLEGRRMTDMIRRERISVLVAVPRVLQLLKTHLLGRFEGLETRLEAAKGGAKLLKWWRFRDVHRVLGWKFWAVISGGAALPAPLEEFWSGIGVPIIQGYGMTETTALITLNYPFKISEGSIGKTLPGREVRLSEDGEILVRGDVVSSTTWIGGAMHTRQGEWLATGDLGERSATGELRFLGRKGDVIVTSGGMNIHPDDLENAMKRQSIVRECVVVPCETPSGIEPVAVVISTGSEEELQQAAVEANRGLADFQQIRRVLHWPELQFPYTSTGKLLRRKVAEWAGEQIQGRQQARPEAAPGSTTDIVLAEIAEVTGEPAPGSDDSLRLGEDLHLDSLGRVQLQSALEQKLGLELADDALAAIETLGELRALLTAESAPGIPAQPPTRPDAPPAARPSLEPPPTTTQRPSGRVDRHAGPQPNTRSAEAQRELTSEDLYPRWPWLWPFAPLRSAFLELVIRPFVWFLGAPRVVFKTAELPAGPLLVIVNHITAYDGALVLYALPGKLRRHMAIAMSGEMLLDYRKGRNQGNALLNLFAPPQYWMVTEFFNVFPLPRLHGFRRSFAHAGEAMDRGYSVMIFPEGERNFDGKLRPFRQGIGLLAQESRVPILPVALIGLDEVARLEEKQKAAWFRSGKLEIRVGEVIPVDDNLDPAALTTRLEAAMRALQS